MLLPLVLLRWGSIDFRERERERDIVPTMDDSSLRPLEDVLYAYFYTRRKSNTSNCFMESSQFSFKCSNNFVN